MGAMVTQFFNARQASEAIGCSPATVSRWASRLGITGKFGSSLVLTADDVEKIKTEWHRHPGNPTFSQQKHERN
jgi:hypothetical protein